MHRVIVLAIAGALSLSGCSLKTGAMAPVSTEYKTPPKKVAVRPAVKTTPQRRIKTASLRTKAPKKVRVQEPSLPFKMKYGKRALKVASNLKGAGCKDLTNAFFDGGAAVFELKNYQRKHKRTMSPVQRTAIKKKTKSFLKLAKVLRKESENRCF